MQTKTYLVTNNSEGSICVTGRTRIDIPGMCKDLVLTLPENTARQTISRLKQRYPLLKIREAQENMAASTDNPENGNNVQPAISDVNGEKGADGSKSDTGQNSASSEASSNSGQASSSTGATNSAVGDDKNSSQTTSSQNQTPTQKPDTKKSK